MSKFKKKVPVTHIRISVFLHECGPIAPILYLNHMVLTNGRLMLIQVKIVIFCDFSRHREILPCQSRTDGEREK